MRAALAGVPSSQLVDRPVPRIALARLSHRHWNGDWQRHVRRKHREPAVLFSDLCGVTLGARQAHQEL